VVELSGGEIMAVWSTEPVSVAVVDHDAPMTRIFGASMTIWEPRYPPSEIVRLLGRRYATAPRMRWVSPKGLAEWDRSMRLALREGS